ncbi:hypothetical protein N9818_00925 [Arcobacteraceae bacterium]|nr:hypothetical protein [Arcobacteraceae bacterium]
MKTIITLSLFLTTQVIANYAFSDEKTVKIDMHGGKSEKFTTNNGFPKMGSGELKGLSSFGMKKTREPIKAEEKNIHELQDQELK